MKEVENTINTLNENSNINVLNKEGIEKFNLTADGCRVVHDYLEYYKKMSDEQIKKLDKETNNDIIILSLALLTQHHLDIKDIKDFIGPLKSLIVKLKDAPNSSNVWKSFLWKN